MTLRAMILSTLTAALAASALPLTACEKPLFPEALPRTQYERYDRLRGRFVPGEERNAYGGSQPALRQRLTPPPQ